MSTKRDGPGPGNLLRVGPSLANAVLCSYLTSLRYLDFDLAGDSNIMTGEIYKRVSLHFVFSHCTAW